VITRVTWVNSSIAKLRATVAIRKYEPRSDSIAREATSDTSAATSPPKGIARMTGTPTRRLMSAAA
jgi:hypothetical protein